MYISIENIIKIGILIIQILFYIIIFFKFHKIKGNKSLTLTDIVNKGKELFTKYIGTINISKLISDKLQEPKPDKPPQDLNNEDK